MNTSTTEFILEQAKEHGSFPANFFPATTEHLFVGIADGSDNYRDIGVKEGTLLFFDRTKPFVDGEPAIFINPELGIIKMLRHKEEGLTCAGALIATLSLL